MYIYIIYTIYYIIYRKNYHQRTNEDSAAESESKRHLQADV